MSRVILDVNNQNSLISLAYIKVNENPLHVFCNYITYLLIKASNKGLRADSLQDELKKEFGLNMPPQLINNCIRVLEKNKEVSRLPNGAGYKILKTEFSLEDFEKARMNLYEHENTVLQSIIRFVNDKFNKKWTETEARKYLSEFMDKEGYGAQLFMEKKVKVKGNRVSPNFYIGRYIDSIQKQPENIENKYLEEITNGMMILQGLCLTRDYSQNKNQKFKGTVFYFDTKLILRALGFSWEAQTRSVREMVHLLRDKYGARVGIFPQTLKEVENALTSAGLALKNHKPIRDEELKLFSELYPEKASLMMEYATNVSGFLNRELGISGSLNINWNDRDVQKYNINIEAIADFIEERCGWKRPMINFDVEIINQINILRRANYAKPYGGNDKLPVFVTSNSKLVYTFRDYVLENNNDDKNWSSHALPVISDNMLLYRIWLPFASESNDLPSLTLARYAYAAQSEGSDFFEKVRQKASEIETMKHIDLIDMPEVARRKLEDILINETDGDPARLTDSVVAMSYDECLKMTHLKLVQERDNYKDKTEKLERQNIELLARNYVNKLGGWRILLFCAKCWWLPAFAALFTVSNLILKNQFCADVILRLIYRLCKQLHWHPQSVNFYNMVIKFGIPSIPILIQFIQFVFDKFVDDRGLRFSVYNKVLLYVKDQYIKKIESDLGHGQYVVNTEDVIQYCLEQTKVFENII